jgi:selenocysteine-specific elongation factor
MHSQTLGILGHVDHGKSALVRALTGIETDRLKEERERGLSIVLGFSHIDTEDATIDLIDVPGHEDFIRAMISGATGLDGIVLVIAANEGMMPQTREHFDIARLLGISRGFVVISKCDLVSPRELEALKTDIARFTAGSFLADAPVVEASSVSGQGMAAVRQAIIELGGGPLERVAGRGFFLPLDRVFSMQGFGVVGTGTLRGGTMGLDSQVEIMPSGQRASVRGLQCHGHSVDSAQPGRRVAVNLRNIGLDTLHRGNVIAAPGLLTPTRRLDVELELLESSPAVRNGQMVRLMLGTSEAMAKLRLLEHGEMEPGSSGLVQLRCDRDIATHAGERFLIRSYSPTRTLGGGRVLDANPPRHRRFDTAVNARLAATAQGTADDLFAQLLADAGTAGLSLESACRRLDCSRGDLEPLVDRFAALRLDTSTVMADSARAELRERVLAELDRFHETNPHRQGQTANALQTTIRPRPHPAALGLVLEELRAAGEIEGNDDALHRAGFDPFAKLGPAAREAAAQIERAYLEAGLAPPPFDVVIGKGEARRHVYRLLLDYGRLEQLRTYDRGQTMVLHAATIEDAKQRIRSRFPHPAKFAVKDIRDLLGSTRKFVVPLMEHFDATGFTHRMGDFRQLREDS